MAIKMSERFTLAANILGIYSSHSCLAIRDTSRETQESYVSKDIEIALEYYRELFTEDTYRNYDKYNNDILREDGLLYQIHFACSFPEDADYTIQDLRYMMLLFAAEIAESEGL